MTAAHRHGHVLPQDLRALRRTVRQFVRAEVVPIEKGMDPEAIEMPPDLLDPLVAKVRAMGLWCVEAPVAFGGGGFNCFWEAVVHEERVQHRAGLYLPGYGCFGTPPPAPLYMGTPDQVERYTAPAVRDGKSVFFAITEPSGGSDPARAIQTTARRDGDDWVLNGSKMFITDALQADYGIVFARTEPGSRRGITCFIVEKGWPGFTLEPIPVIRPYYPAQLYFDNVRVPGRNVVGEVHRGWDILANKLLARNRIPYAAANLGVAVAAQEMAVAYSKRRETFGQPLASRQAIQWMLVDSEIDIRASRWLVWEAAWEYDDGEEFRSEAAIAKLFSSEALGRVVDRAVQVHGGLGVAKALPLERWYRKARVRRIGEGPSEVMRMVIAREMLR